MHCKQSRANFGVYVASAPTEIGRINDYLLNHTTREKMTDDVTPQSGQQTAVSRLMFHHKGAIKKVHRTPRTPTDRNVYKSSGSVFSPTDVEQVGAGIFRHDMERQTSIYMWLQFQSQIVAP